MRAIALLLMMASSSAAAVPLSARVAADVDAAFTAFRDKTTVPGLAYGVVKDGQLVHLRFEGVRDVATKSAVNERTRFRIASMSKAFTALAILKLRDEGKLRLDDLAEQHIPEMRSWRYPTADSPRLRIRDLLHHVGGFVTDDPWGDRQQPISAADFSAMIAAGVPWSRPPQTQMEYSNFGYALLGRIVTNASGMPFDHYVERTIMQPLGMGSSGYEFRDVPVSDRAIGYRWEDERWVEEPTMAHGEFGAMGGVYVTAGDYARWVEFLLSAWPPRDGPDNGPVKRSTVRELAQGLNFLATRKRIGGPADDQCEWAQAYAMGLIHIRDCTLGLTLSHGGGYPGYGSFMALAPERRTGIFALTNRTYAGPSEPVWRALLILDREGVIPPEKRIVAPVLEEMQAAAHAAYKAGSLEPLKDKLAMNFEMDRSAAAWTREFAKLQQQVGKCTSAEPLFATGALSTAFRWNCERGHLNGQILLAPTNPPTIQALRFTPLPK